MLQRPFVSPNELAELTGVPVQTIREKCRKGQLKSVRIGRHYRIPLAAISELDKYNTSRLALIRAEALREIRTKLAEIQVLLERLDG